LTGSFTDPGSVDTHSFLWHVSSDNGQIVADATTQNFSFVPTDNGIYTIDFTVTDKDGGSSSKEVNVTVNNVAPTLVISGDSFVAEGVTYYLTLSATDPGADTLIQWKINWGDGTVDTLPGNATVATHQYVPLAFVADLDGDGDVDGRDALVFSNNYGQTGPGLAGDFDQDGDVDAADLAVFSQHFGNIGYDAYTVSATATDEDGTYNSNTILVTDPPLPEASADAAVNATAGHEGKVPQTAARQRRMRIRLLRLPTRTKTTPIIPTPS